MNELGKISEEQGSNFLVEVVPQLRVPPLLVVRQVTGESGTRVTLYPLVSPLSLAVLSLFTNDARTHETFFRISKVTVGSSTSYLDISCDKPFNHDQRVYKRDFWKPFQSSSFWFFWRAFGRVYLVATRVQVACCFSHLVLHILVNLYSPKLISFYRN